MKQLTLCPGPSTTLWVVWVWKESDGVSRWSATGLFSERYHAEDHAKPGDFVGRYDIQARYRASNIVLEEEVR